MTTWEAANVAPAKKRRDQTDERAGRKDRSLETVEAALNRLSKAYGAAMECVGAWHRADHATNTTANAATAATTNSTSTTEGDNPSDALASRFKSLQQVGQAARLAFEKAILLDPLIAAHAPLLSGVVRDWAAVQGHHEQLQQQQRRHRWSMALQKRAAPPSLSSAGHQSTVSQLAYLSLVNYADLLLAGCQCCRDSNGSSSALSTTTKTTTTTTNTTVLDRGVVRPLRILSSGGNSSINNTEGSCCCCWNDPTDPASIDGSNDNENQNQKGLYESAQDTVRLAVTALIDASALDGSDPILWLKLACAARRLGRLQAWDANNDKTAYCEYPVTLLSFRRLEKHALERARTALPPALPPNRTVVKALEEWNREEQSLAVFPEKLTADCAEPQQLTLELPRYSWSILGRMLARACREGTAYSSGMSSSSNIHGTPRRAKLGYTFASPAVKLRLSPMLALPSSVLGTICQYLEPSSIWRFEATCRALSASIISARAAMDHSVVVKEREKTEKPKENPKKMAEETSQSKDKEKEVSNDDAAGDDSERNSAHAASRASKRLRSQIITSGKRAERSSRRSSTEYCLLAATLGCTTDDKRYREVQDTALDWEMSISLDKAAQRDTQGPSPSRRGSLGKQTRHREEARERMGESALSVFVERWSSCDSPPLGILFGFVSHVSLHVSDVFSSDPGGSMVLVSCLMECVDIMMRRNRSCDILTPSWSAFGFTMPSNIVQSPLELFAIDLLHVELRFKACERNEFTDTDYDADGSVLASMVPHLLSKIEELDERLCAGRSARLWTSLKTRCFWLATGFYIWIGRRCQNVSESREAETIGLEFIEDTLSCLRLPKHRPLLSLQTPHLLSPGRSGARWKELSVDSVTAYRNEIQASSVVLLAQEQFLEATSSIVGTSQDVALDEGVHGALFLIGSTLLERYMSPTDSPGSKYLELIDDFLARYGEELLSHDDEPESFQALFDTLVPAGCVNAQQLLGLSSPCILTILVTCLNMKMHRRPDVVQLLARLAITLAGLPGIFRGSTDQSRVTFSESNFPVDDSDSDDDSLMSDGEPGMNNGRATRSTDRLRLRQYGRLIQLFTEKIRTIFVEHMTADEKSAFVLSDEYHQLIAAIMGYAADSFHKSLGHQVGTGYDDTEDFQVFLSTKALIETVFDCFSTSEKPEKAMVRMYLKGLIRIIVQQRLNLSSLLQTSGDASTRSLLAQRRKGRTDFLAAVCCEIGLLLSQHGARIDGGTIQRSDLFDGVLDYEESSNQLFVLSESLLWLWEAAHGAEVSVAHTETESTNGPKLESTLDRASRVRLQVPVAAAVIGLCGSAVSTKHSISNGVSSGASEETIRLAEFYDSDTSAMDWLVDEGEEEIIDADTKREELLRIISQAVYCMKHILGSIAGDEVSSYSFYSGYLTKHGPILPLVACRVLNAFANSLLVDFVPEDYEKSAPMHLWSDYSFGTRTTGVLLDSLLYKAYRHLHGFSLVNTSDGRESSGGGPAAGDTANLELFPPEHPAAAASLYRCIMRAYSHGRKSPPKASLETVLSSLPPMKGATKTKGIHKYLFGADEDYFELKDLVSLVTRDSRWETRFASMSDWDWDSMRIADESNASEEEAAIVRKGISSLLAQGPLPTFQDAGGDNDGRESTMHAEDELSKKFIAIIDDLCQGNTTDCESWYKAAQCLVAKADLIADRLGLLQGFSRSRNFSVTEHSSLSEASIAINELLSEQELEAHLKSEGWVDTLGNDLSIYIRHTWSSFQSLQSCSEETGAAYKETVPQDEFNTDEFKAQVWKEIDDLNTKNDHAGSQQAWGGLFVSSLRIMAVRCMCMGVYILYKQSERSVEDSLLVSEMTEFLGITLYSQIMGSQVYGYPLHVLGDQRKRELAEASLACLECALQSNATPDSQDSDNGRITWDLLFLIGKCHEKIASTYQRETFPADVGSGGTAPIRKYERHIEKALQAYAQSLAEAKAIEKEGGVMIEQNGGSAHGSGEVLYRLHASRLKCLIRAVDHKEDERESAELEALRLTECHWFIANHDEKVDSEGVRDRVWYVVADVVSGLAQCRLNQPFFHRSVYRHAQALMWAPVLCDPIGERVNGSLGMVPATRAFKLRGLNFSTNAANSGMSVISTLFEKKRAQLCAVWVTSTGASSTFQTINNTVRKYDSLRGKYIGAYLDCLRLCQRKNELETFYRWTSSCRRDLPSFFSAASALVANGGKTELPHTRDCLLVKGRSLASHHFLTTVKRECNSALASVILHQVKTSEASQDSKTPENHLRAAYACFLRLNCEPEDLTRGRSWKYHRRSVGIRDIIELLTTAYLKVSKDQPTSGSRSDWSGEAQKVDILKMALDTCKSMFPSMSGALFSRKRSTKPKMKTDSPTPSASGTKRQRDPSTDTKEGITKRSFEVKVPAGLKAGDHFLVSLQAHGVEKKVKLTVPAGTPATLRFTLKVPTPTTKDSPEKT